MLFIVTSRAKGTPPVSSFVFSESSERARDAVLDLRDFREGRTVECSVRLPTSEECDRAGRAFAHVSGDK